MVQIDRYVWGEEQILCGFDPSHKYTFKLLKPKPGREGCLSLQSHEYKEETWYVVQGTAWGVFIDGDVVYSKVLPKGSAVHIPAGRIHRLVSLAKGTTVAEASTPDAHAADKQAMKDVIRYHCVHGRTCVKVDSPYDILVAKAVEFTNQVLERFDAINDPEDTVVLQYKDYLDSRYPEREFRLEVGEVS